MAGGMGSRDRGLTLADRSGVTARERPPASACHCWVIGQAGASFPGLLLEWRKHAGRWQGLVAYVQSQETAGYVLLQSWLDADRLRAAGRGR
jgi:hypothetical protein